MSEGSRSLERSGKARGATGKTCSACTCSTARLVTRMLRRGQPARRCSSCEAAATTCSKLSSSSNRRLSCRNHFNRSSRRNPSRSLIARCWAMVGRIRSGSLMGASEMKETPSTKSLAREVPTCTARRVLPTPPVPTRVSRRTSERSRRLQMAATSCSRPINWVNCAGRGARMPGPAPSPNLGLTTLRSPCIVKDPPLS